LTCNQPDVQLKTKLHSSHGGALLYYCIRESHFSAHG
jgi:hypothetical protein